MENERYIGVLEKSISHGIRGWVIDQQFPETKLQVIIEFDNCYSVLRPANIFRQNLWQGAKGHHGFELRLTDIPAALLSRQLKIVRATLLRKDFECTNSPMEFDRLSVARSVCGLVYSDLEDIFA